MTNAYTADGQFVLPSPTSSADPNNQITLESFTYDAIGNRTMTGYASNNLNQYTSIPNPDGSGGTLTPTYNSRGDLTSDGKFNYTYDAMDRMVSAEAISHSQEAKYSYDSQGRLISETVLTNYDTNSQTYGTSVTRNFAYDGDELIAELDSSGNVLKSYQYGIGKSGKVGALLSVTDYTGGTPVTYTAVNDSSGNLAELLDSSGNIAATFTYSAFGKPLTATGTAATVSDVTWQGLFFDRVTSMYDADLRWQSPWIGRWTTRDPLGEQGGDDLEDYCNNDPINNSDSTGLFWSWAAAGIGSLVGATVSVTATIVTDVVRGQPITTGQIVGSAVSGAITGGIIGGAAGALTGDPTALIAVAGVAGALSGPVGGPP